ncbi:hypothetical protein PF005_g979 [Phytophthora fragariae]|uniref:RxLR effector protein n=1 Tax=Phytophthora fragariae TaxID=53985 RepID=A0A6A3T3R1_9STRA|nr:hypothetical protein PF003_g1467 [Phytophthora fragariae]KAE8944983.1 hypothetical protein PF009_g5353 [Phytophthora fragariae]KAE9021417.1 hypothetical protein PF011_g4951 [Phytophthora fragariae]KAE9125881.1 hypothetical protein PF010_g5462 [Phytophthora fragariae]KAE9129490.1 hypothetical protein PF007_g4864 [Phytophthora fragariae]
MGASEVVAVAVVAVAEPSLLLVSLVLDPAPAPRHPI